MYVVLPVVMWPNSFIYWPQTFLNISVEIMVFVILVLNGQWLRAYCLTYVVFTLNIGTSTVVSTKSDSDVILCLQLLSKMFTCTPHLS